MTIRDVYTIPDSEFMECLGDYHDLYKVRMMLINHPDMVVDRAIDVEKFAKGFSKLDKDFTEDQGKEIAIKINSIL